MIDQVISHINEQAAARVDRLCEFLKIPSISTDPQRKGDLLTGAEWVKQQFEQSGFDTEIVDTAGHPCVLADTGPADGNEMTVLVYGHYDVQPAGDESLWDSPPFEPTIRDGAVYARGSADDKGQLLTHVFAAQSWIAKAGKLPLRIKFVVEGEEEIGSPNLGGVLKAHKDRLACDYVVLSDTPKYNADIPAITYGTKGMVYKEINLVGAKQDLHSGSFGGTLLNPGNILANIISSLKDKDHRVTIPGFYDKVRDLTKVERERIAALPFSEEDYARGLGVASLGGETGYATLERKWARPTLDVNGLLTGFTGEGSMTVLPSRAMAKVSMRLVPDQTPEEIGVAFDQAVRSACPDGIKLEIKEFVSCSPYVADLESPGIHAAAAAMKAGFDREPVFIREGGSLPILPLFKEVLGADSLMLGFCLPDCNAHGPNEVFLISDLHAGTRSAAHLIDQLSRV